MVNGDLKVYKDIRVGADQTLGIVQVARNWRGTRVTEKRHVLLLWVGVVIITVAGVM